jgi:hypothetical protein
MITWWLKGTGAKGEIVQTCGEYEAEWYFKRNSLDASYAKLLGKWVTFHIPFD